MTLRVLRILQNKAATSFLHILIDFIDFKTKLFHHITIYHLQFYTNTENEKNNKNGDLPIGRVHAIQYYDNILISSLLVKLKQSGYTTELYYISGDRALD